MSDRDENPEAPDAEPRSEPPRARVHPVEWAPWLWVVPILALLVVGWLVVRYAFRGGGEITVRFVEARGLDRYSPVRYRGAKVGTVEKITLDEHLQEVQVRISMDAQLKDALRKGTQFWIVEPGIEGGVASLLSGTYIGIAPGTGERTNHFVGLEHPPILAAPEAGKIFILESEGIGEAVIGSPIEFRGMRVGRVLGADYDLQRGVDEVHVFVLDRYAGFVRESTQWWRTGGLGVSFEGGRLSLGGSLASLATPGFSFTTPEVLSGNVAAEGRHFELYETRAAAMAAAEGPQFAYRTYFPGTLKGLAAGTPVEMRGLVVGGVRDVELRYVPATASLETPVTLAIDARKLGLDEPTTGTREELRARLDHAIAQLVRKGMRAGLSTSLVLPGVSAVSLDLVATPGTAQLITSTDPPIIPAAGGGSGLEGAMVSVQHLATKIDELPLQQIAGDLRSAARRFDEFAHDPRLDQSLDRLHRAMGQLEQTTSVANENVRPVVENLRKAATEIESAARQANEASGKVNANVEPVVESLKRAATSAESAAARANSLLGSAPRQSYDLAQLVEQVSRAAESVRALADYLSEHPDALLRGRAP